MEYVMISERARLSRSRPAQKALRQANFRFWHNSDLPRRLPFGRFWGRSGHQSALE